ncbi:MAG: TIGR04168 family protein [Cyanobacteria bacterium J06633_23]
MALIGTNKTDLDVMAGRSAKIAIVGDVHGQWSSADSSLLESLGVDLVLFVGDFGNEALSIVRQVAAVPLPKAVILGNHDAWYTASKRNRKDCPYDPLKEDRLQQQLDALGACHVGFDKLEVPLCKLTVIGARPYSWGGSRWRHQQFYQERCHVGSFEESAAKICRVAKTAEQDTLIFLGHNGPAGLGGQGHDICGRDWKRNGGDYGDPDFADAIAHTQRSGKQVALVVFGHMHHELRHDKTRLRQRLVVDDYGTVYVNGAQVPRVIETEAGRQHSFTLVTLQAGRVQAVRLVWINDTANIVAEEYLYRCATKTQHTTRRVGKFGLA